MYGDSHAFLEMNLGKVTHRRLDFIPPDQYVSNTSDFSHPPYFALPHQLTMTFHRFFPFFPRSWPCSSAAGTSQAQPEFSASVRRCFVGATSSVVEVMGTAGPRTVACFAVGAALNLLSVEHSAQLKV